MQKYEDVIGAILTTSTKIDRASELLVPRILNRDEQVLHRSYNNC